MKYLVQQLCDNHNMLLSSPQVRVSLFSKQQRLYNNCIDRNLYINITSKCSNSKLKFQIIYRTMLILSEQDVRQCFDMATCIQVNRQALVSLAVPNAAIVPTRIGLPYIPPSSTITTTTSSNNGATDWTLFKPASASSTHNTIIEDADDNDDTTATASTSHMGIKIVSVRKDNDQLGLPLVPATIVQLNPQSGIVDAIVAGTFLTAARTAAGSALSAQYVLNNNHNNNNNNIGRICHHLVIFGAGLQAEMHIWALSIALGYSFEYCTIINRNQQRAEQLACRVRDDMGWVQNCSVVSLHDTNTIHTVLSTADCIVTATNTIQPLWDDDDNNKNSNELSISDIEKTKVSSRIKNGCHIMGIGSYTPTMQEIPTTTVKSCQVYIDTIDALTVGDLKDYYKHSTNTTTTSLSDQQNDSPPIQLLGSVLLQQQQHDRMYNTNEYNDIYPNTFYKAVGTAIQDVLSADAIVKRARELGIGTEVEMS